MSDAPWLTIVGLGENGPDGLAPASQAALDAAEVIMGPPRHLDLLPDTGAERIVWPVPFADGLPILEGLRGRRVVVLASGDPFWFGAGSVIARILRPEEWHALPGPSVFSLAVAAVGWPLEDTVCLGLHAAPFERMRPKIAHGQRLIVLVRDGEAATGLAWYLKEIGFGASRLVVLERLGGPNERRTQSRADQLTGTFAHPVCVAIEADGPRRGIPCASGIPDDFFETDGQMTKRPIRAMTLSALAPGPSDMLWDIGGGTGSIAIEWLLSHPGTQAMCVEPRDDRAERIVRNAQALGVERLRLVRGTAPEALSDLPCPDAVFIGGGVSHDMLIWLQRNVPGARLVANGVTLEAEALIADWHARIGGEVMRIELSQARTLGEKRGWAASFPIVQWSVTL